MQKINKKEVHKIAEEAMHYSLKKLKVVTPSKKTNRKLSKISKELFQVLKEEIKRVQKHSQSGKVKPIKKISKATSIDKKEKKSK